MSELNLLEDLEAWFKADDDCEDFWHLVCCKDDYIALCHANLKEGITIPTIEIVEEDFCKRCDAEAAEHRCPHYGKCIEL